MVGRLARTLFAGVAVLLASAASADPGALARIVDTQCVPHMLAGMGPAPCAAVDIAGGYVILKDINGAYQYLLIATAPVSGIEDAALLAMEAPNYWQAAWNARNFVETALGRPLSPDWISVAVNSRYGRSQNRLHIHIDCLGRETHEALAAQAAAITTAWSPLKLAGHEYEARRIEGASLGAETFRLVADTLPGARADMRAYTVLVTGALSADGKPGFYLLVGRAFSSAFDLGHAEELQDHACGLGAAP